MSLIAGRNGGTWNGANGIMSSAVPGTPNSALGYGEASSIVGANGGTFAGQTVDATALLVRFTLIGDVNLDRKVDISDLGLLSGNWQQSGVGWADGDLDYNGKVDISDLGLLSGDWQAVYTPPVANAVERPVKSGKVAVKVARPIQKTA